MTRHSSKRRSSRRLRANSSLRLVDSRVSDLVQALEQAGWRLTSAEIDTHASTARIEIKGGDRLITLDARNGRATLTREIVRIDTVRVGRRGDTCRVDRLHTTFLGRSRYDGLRSAMRGLANYLADNAPIAALPISDTRRLLAPLLTGWSS